MVSKKGVVAVIAACAVAVLVLASCQADNGSSAKAAGGDSLKTPSADSSQEGAYHKIDAEEGKRMMDAGGVIVVDVRTPSEYAEGHIPGAVNVPNEDIGSQQPDGLEDLDATLIVYCRTGVRSKQAADKLVELGYQSVYDMGGIVDWPYDTVSGDGDE